MRQEFSPNKTLAQKSNEATYWTDGDLYKQQLRVQLSIISSSAIQIYRQLSSSRSSRLTITPRINPKSTVGQNHPQHIPNAPSHPPSHPPADSPPPVAQQAPPRAPLALGGHSVAGRHPLVAQLPEGGLGGVGG